MTVALTGEAVRNIGLGTTSIGLIASIIGIIIGIFLIRSCTGKLRLALSFLIASITLFAIYYTVYFLKLGGAISGEVITNLFHLIIVTLILTSLILMLKMIVNINSPKTIPKKIYPA